MSSNILDTFATDTALTITLASLAISVAANGVGRQSTMVDNTTTRYTHIKLTLSIKMGTNPTASAPIYVFLICSNADATTETRDDSAGASDAGLTQVNSRLIGVLFTKSSAATGDQVTQTIDFDNPGPKWGILVVNGLTAGAFNSTEANHVKTYVGSNLQAQ